MPNTPILQLLFEIVVADAWRMKLALRGEQRAVKSNWTQETILSP
jgi:hypothetical protein